MMLTGSAVPRSLRLLGWRSAVSTAAEEGTISTWSSKRVRNQITTGRWGDKWQDSREVWSNMVLALLPGAWN